MHAPLFRSHLRARSRRQTLKTVVKGKHTRGRARCDPPRQVKAQADIEAARLHLRLVLGTDSAYDNQNKNEQNPAEPREGEESDFRLPQCRVKVSLTRRTGTGDNTCAAAAPGHLLADLLDRLYDDGRGRAGN